MTATIGGPAEVLADDAVAAFVEAQFAALDLDGRSLCLVIPDATRNCPLPLLLGAIVRAVEGRVRSGQAVVALGTHAAMTEAEMRALVGVDGLAVVNHEWWDDDTFAPLGTLAAEEVSRLSGGRLEES
ncbi:MAG TPA: lactate racemase domain-containing protein, partial [Acidimicrobiales bacterium]